MSIVPDLAMRPLTPLGRRVLDVQARHAGECVCPCCEGTATLGQVQDAERSLGIVRRGKRPSRC